MMTDWRSIREHRYIGRKNGVYSDSDSESEHVNKSRI
jgi:hypothetical protein